ncbi:MAG: hypothetical protein PUC94_02150 [Bacteroidales bacterium]|nr:hypothetical protein [Bacteroidales bacterium]
MAGMAATAQVTAIYKESAQRKKTAHSVVTLDKEPVFCPRQNIIVRHKNAQNQQIAHDAHVVGHRHFVRNVVGMQTHLFAGNAGMLMPVCYWLIGSSPCQDWFFAGSGELSQQAYGIAFLRQIYGYFAPRQNSQAPNIQRTGTGYAPNIHRHPRTAPVFAPNFAVRDKIFRLGF